MSRILRGITAALMAVLLPAMLGAAASYSPSADAAAHTLSADVVAKLPAERKGKVLLYGAYGFTGKGIARLAKEYGITPILSGRNEEKLSAFAGEVGLEYITLSLDDNHANLVEILRHFELVLHIAGPYTFTAKPMLDAVVEAGTHYVDLTGENHVILDQLDRHEEFVAANVMVMPAVGYDVVPTDCLNMYVAQNLSEPTLLVLEMNGNYTDVEGTPASRGTIKSALELLSRPLQLRIDGKMVESVEPKVIEREVDGQTQTLLQIPWADMVTSWVSTGVPTIEVYQLQDGTVPGWLPWLAQREWGKKLLVWAIDTFAPEGPPPEAQENRQTRLVSTATNRAGETFSAEMITPEPYRLTFHSTLIIANKILAGQWSPGFQTPAKMYGSELALEIPGVTRRDL
ncbi:MAG: trans-acting enoyl reductase family protein [Halioglobus sp.]